MNTIQNIYGYISGLATAMETAPSLFRNTGVGTTSLSVKASSGNLYGVNIINPSAFPVYAKLFDNASGIVGTTTPKHTFLVKANDELVIHPNVMPLSTFSTAISVACTSGLADTNSTQLASLTQVELFYS